MPDSELQDLVHASKAATPDPLHAPPDASLAFLGSLDLDGEDLELLLGEAPGLSWTDVKQETQAFFDRLRLRTAQLVCDDDKLKASVDMALKSGAEAGWLALVAGFGFGPGTVVATALKPIAAALVTTGVGKLCSKGM
jgi:hypothetical protein